MATKRKRSTIPPERMLSVRISPDLVEDFRLVAKRNERSVSQELRLLMAQHVALNDEKQAA